MKNEDILEMFAQLLQGQTEIREELNVLKNDLRQLSSKVDAEIMGKISSLYDAREIPFHILYKLEDIENKLLNCQCDTNRMERTNMFD